MEITERELGRLEQKVDTVLANQDRFMELHEKLDNRITEKHEKLANRIDTIDNKFATRIGSVENKIHWYTGGMATISAAFVFMGDQIRRVFFGH